MVVAGILIWLLLICTGLYVLRSLEIYNSIFSDGAGAADVPEGKELEHPIAVYLANISVVEKTGAKGQTITQVTITSSGSGTINPLLAGVLMGATLLYIIAIVIKVYRKNRR